MIDPARVVATDGWIDDVFSIAQAKKKSMRALRLFSCILPGEDSSGVFDDPASFRYALQGINAPAVNLRTTNLKKDGSRRTSWALLCRCSRSFLFTTASAVGAFHDGSAASKARLCHDCSNLPLPV